MILIKNTQRKIKINISKLKKDAQAMLDALRYGEFDLGIWLTTNSTIKKYNREYRKKDKPTDILSFPFYPKLKPGKSIKAQTKEEKNLGDLIISLEYVKKDSPAWGQTFSKRMEVLLAHGICHLLGYDHEKDSDYKNMQKKEQFLLAALKKH